MALLIGLLLFFRRRNKKKVASQTEMSERQPAFPADPSAEITHPATGKVGLPGDPEI